MQARATLSAYDAELGKPALLPGTRLRLETQADAVRANVAFVNTLLEPALSENQFVPVDAAATDPGDVRSLLALFELLLRDWGWRGEPGDENERAVTLIEEACRRTSSASWKPGAMLVLGAGASRLAYDLHRRCGASSTTALDVDVLLLSVAARMIRGEELSLAEAPTDANQMTGLRQDLVLKAPGGAASGVYLLLGDGLEPPFPDASFDTVVTPWFIDQVPSDLRMFLGAVERVLKPGGCWINYGPLIHPALAPLATRFTIDEVAELTRLAGFAMGPVVKGAGPYLVSPLTMRGRHELSFAFCARKGTDRPDRRTVDGRAAWLVLPYLPIPDFPERTRTRHPRAVASRILSTIDGRRSLADLARQLGDEAGMDPADLHDGIRAILLEVHPAAQTG